MLPNQMLVKVRMELEQPLLETSSSAVPIVFIFKEELFRWVLMIHSHCDYWKD